MTTQVDYNAEEWNTILRAPVLAGLFIVQADVYDPFVAYMKMLAVWTAITESAQRGLQCELIQAVTSAVLAGQCPTESIECPRDLAEARRMVLDGCRRAAALLAQKAPAAEADEYNHWLMMISQKVALVPDTKCCPDHPIPTIDTKTRTALEMLAITLDTA